MPPALTDPHITEPMTMATDYLLAAQVLIYAIALRRKAPSLRHGSVRFWVAAFLVTAVAALAGGTAHGFALYLGETYLALVWGLTVLAISFSAALMIFAGVRSARHPHTEDPIRRKLGTRWLVRGIFVTLAGLAIQQSGWSLDRHFNHNDLYHVVQMVGIFCLYRGAVLLDDLRTE